MHVAQLWRFPVKSMAGERLDEVAVGPQGVEGDRELYVVSPHGEILSARTRPKLLGHHATRTAAGDVLVDGVPWDTPEVAAAVERAAGPGARLVRATGPERFDVLPLLVVTDGALEAFGHDGRRLRPNVVLGDVPGLAEREWEHRLLRTGDAVIALADLRGRCIITTFDPDTVDQDVDVLLDIRRRFGGTFALNAWAGQSGTLRVGAPVEHLEAPVPLATPGLGRFAA